MQGILISVHVQKYLYYEIILQVEGIFCRTLVTSTNQRPKNQVTPTSFHIIDKNSLLEPKSFYKNALLELMQESARIF